MPSVSMTDRARRDQRSFRTLLQAMSSPGRLFRLDATDRPFDQYPALAIAECLMDQEVSFGMAGDGVTEAFHHAIQTTTGARPARLEEADFLFIFGRGNRDAISLAKRGSLEFPDEGATLIYCVGADEEPDTERFLVRLSGPGIAAPEGIAPEMQGLDLEELRELSSVNADYPLGVDSIFIRATGEVMCLPRCTRIQVR